MKKLEWHQWLLVVLFLVVVFLTGFFGFRAIRHAVYWHNHRDEPIRSWMSVPYVARSYRVAPHLLYRAIGLPPTERDRRPLREIAREQNRPVETLISELKDAIVHSRSPDQEGSKPPPVSTDGGPPR
jgi:hypothetical protein